MENKTTSYYLFRVQISTDIDTFFGSERFEAINLDLEKANVSLNPFEINSLRSMNTKRSTDTKSQYHCFVPAYIPNSRKCSIRRGKLISRKKKVYTYLGTREYSRIGRRKNKKNGGWWFLKEEKEEKRGGRK